MKTTTESESLDSSWRGSWKTLERYGSHVLTLEDERKANRHLPVLSAAVRETDKLLDDLRITMKYGGIDY